MKRKFNVPRSLTGSGSKSVQAKSDDSTALGATKRSKPLVSPAAPPVAKPPSAKPLPLKPSKAHARMNNTKPPQQDVVVVAPETKTETVPAPAAAAPPSHQQRRTFRLPSVLSNSLPTLTSLGFNTLLPPALTMLNGLTKLPTSLDASFLDIFSISPEALSQAIDALEESFLPTFYPPTEANAKMHTSLVNILNLPRTTVSNVCVVHAQPFQSAEGGGCGSEKSAAIKNGAAAAAALPDAEARIRAPNPCSTSLTAAAASSAVWVPTPEGINAPYKRHEVGRCLAEDVEIPISLLKSLIFA